MRDSRKIAKASNDLNLFIWWFVTLVGATCIFKLNYLKDVYDLRVMLHYLFEPIGALDRGIHFLSFFINDIVEVFFIASLVYIVGRWLLCLNFKTLIVVTTPILLFFAIANLLSFSQLKSALTIETLWISISWALSDPEAIESFILTDMRDTFVSSRIAAPLAAVLAWCALPYVFSRISLHQRMEDQERLCFWVTLSIVMLALACAGTMSLVDRPLSAASWGVLALFLLVLVLASYLLRHWVPWSRIASRFQTYTPIAFILSVLFCGLLYVFGGSNSFERTPLVQGGHWSTIATSLFSNTSRDYEDMAVPPIEDLRRQYYDLVYPRDDGSAGGKLLALPADQTKPRHIVMFSLETAFQRQYRLFDDPSLSNFHRMSRQAIVSEKHQTVAPFTISAAFSMLSGIYPRRNVNGNFAPDSLPHVLARHGYASTYIDAFRTDWMPGTKRNHRLFEALGFDRMLDMSTVPDLAEGKAFASSYQRVLRQEEAAFERALMTVQDAESRDQPALVFVQSVLGHFPWRAPPSHENDRPEAKIRGLASELDRLFGIFLDGLDEAGLTNDVIVVIAGDHGLRHVNEFQSLGFTFAHSDLAFNVPLIVSAPGLLQRQVEIPYVTSHIDLAPTLLGMIGVPSDGLFLHGENLLNRKISQRVTFMLNTKLSPVDGFHWNDNFITYDRTSGTAQLALEATGSDARPLMDAMREGAPLPASLKQPQAMIDSANEIIDLTIAHFTRHTPQDQ